jgi:rhamnogalacturonyl hydrolase YesR
MQAVFTGLSDGNYTFTVFLHDSRGHISERAKIVAKVYGDRYVASLSSREIRGAIYIDGAVQIVLAAPDAHALGAELRYADAQGDTQTVYVDRTQDTASLASYKKGTDFRYRSLYKPAADAVDTFYTPYHSVKTSSPEETGDLVASLFMATPDNKLGRGNPPHAITYPEVCTWYGALKFAKASGNQKMVDELVRRFDPLLGKDSALVPVPDHVDFTVFGIVPFELYLITKDQRYLKIGRAFVDKQWGEPFGSRVPDHARQYAEEGYSWQTRLWVDDMYMITSVETMAYRATGEEKYIDRAAREMVLYLDSLQRPNGLFYHAPDVPFYWGRGNGWVAVGMTELLRSLPPDNAYRARILDSYKQMMDALLKYQTSEGIWRQLLIDPTAWPETSCTGMFTYAMITGVKHGWLDKKTYGAAALNAWVGLRSFLNENGALANVCEGTNKKNDRQYYLDRKRNTGDLHGQAPLLWCAAALLEE